MSGNGSQLHLVPVEWKHVREFIADWHRHNKPPTGWKFGVGVADNDGTLVGVASVGRPVSKVIQAEGFTLEVNRTCTDGTRNANSMLYGACIRVTFGLGWRRLITYTQADESGASLRASGFRVIAELPPRAGWDTPSRPRVLQGNESTARTLWERGVA